MARSSWSDSDVVDKYVTEGFTDRGESQAFAELWPALSGGRVLDLGVGAGRTTRLLAPVAPKYVGVDLSKAMVELARERNPGVDIRCADARRLGADFPDGAYDLVIFSFNGIDSVDHSGREAVLAEMHRVLRPGGRLLFSSLNIDGPYFDERPWRLPPVPDGAPAERMMRKVLAFVRVVAHPRTQLASLRNFEQSRRHAGDGDGWSMRPMRGHEFRFVVLFASPGATTAMLRHAGLVPVRGWTQDGEEFDVTAERSAAGYLHYLCRQGALRS